MAKQGLRALADEIAQDPQLDKKRYDMGRVVSIITGERQTLDKPPRTIHSLYSLTEDGRVFILRWKEDKSYWERLPNIPGDER